MKIYQSYAILAGYLVVITIVSGTLICPPTYGLGGGGCVQGCTSDSECTGGKSCCSNGCGRSCQQKVESTDAECRGELPPILNSDRTKKTCTSSCSDGEYCDGSVCCPVTKCRGHGKTYQCLTDEQRWRFNTFTGRCESFMGCIGEGNNYRTQYACEDSCRPACGGKDIIQTDEICTSDNIDDVCPASSISCDSSHGTCCSYREKTTGDHATKPSYTITIYLSTIICLASALLM